MDQVGRNYLRDCPASDAMRANIRRAIIEEMERRKMNTNALAILVAAKVHRSHVYDFVAGRKELTTQKANFLLSALGLEIVAAEDGARPQEKATGRIL